MVSHNERPRLLCYVGQIFGWLAVFLPQARRGPMISHSVCSMVRLDSQFVTISSKLTLIDYH